MRVHGKEGDQPAIEVIAGAGEELAAENLGMPDDVHCVPFDEIGESCND